MMRRVILQFGRLLGRRQLYLMISVSRALSPLDTASSALKDFPRCCWFRGKGKITLATTGRWAKLQ